MNTNSGMSCKILKMSHHWTYQYLFLQYLSSKSTSFRTWHSHYVLTDHKRHIQQQGQQDHNAGHSYSNYIVYKSWKEGREKKLRSRDSGYISFKFNDQPMFKIWYSKTGNYRCKTTGQKDTQNIELSDLFMQRNNLIFYFQTLRLNRRLRWTNGKSMKIPEKSMHKLLAVKARLFNTIMDNQNTSTRQAQILPGWALSAEAAEGHLEVKMNDATIWFTNGMRPCWGCQNCFNGKDFVLEIEEAEPIPNSRQEGRLDITYNPQACRTWQCTIWLFNPPRPAMLDHKLVNRVLKWPLPAMFSQRCGLVSTCLSGLDTSTILMLMLLRIIQSLPLRGTRAAASKARELPRWSLLSMNLFHESEAPSYTLSLHPSRQSKA